jgi:hypothetical protein
VPDQIAQYVRLAAGDLILLKNDADGLEAHLLEYSTCILTTFSFDQDKRVVVDTLHAIPSFTGISTAGVVLIKASVTWCSQRGGDDVDGSTCIDFLALSDIATVDRLD